MQHHFIRLSPGLGGADEITNVKVLLSVVWEEVGGAGAAAVPCAVRRGWECGRRIFSQTDPEGEGGANGFQTCKSVLREQ